MIAYTYLLINFFTVIICFLASFHHKLKFNRHFAAFLLSSCMVAVFFIAWDVWFTGMKVWWFNKQYTLGIDIWGLPLEEILFFICIPFSCVFTYFCLDKFYKLSWKPFSEQIFAVCLIFFFIILAIFTSDKIYPFVTFSTCAISVFLLYFIFKIKWLGKASTIYLLLSPGFLLVNGILTGTGLQYPIVVYNAMEIIGLRIVSIPVEDFFYGYELILWNLFLFKKFKKND